MKNHSSRSTRLIWLLSFATALALTFGGVWVIGPTGEVQAERGRRPLWQDPPRSGSKLTVDMPSLADQVDRLSPSVVSITVMMNRPSGRSGRADDFFRRFFGGIPDSYRGRGIGTGFIINSRGHILTNSHVVENASQVMVQLHDGTTLAAEVVAIDPPTDIALLRIPTNGRNLPVATLGDSNSLRIGDWVVAIGNPFGLDYTVTTGIVSALERREINPEGRGGYHNYIQTDASINPGNSGGPLFNLRGEVVGINGAINTAGQGIGFAIPINMAKTLLPLMARDGVVRRSWMGVATQPVTRVLARSFGLTGDPRGALVSEVVDGGPAARAGIREGDVVLGFNGEDIDRSDDLPWVASTAGIGRRVPVVIWRGGRRQTITITLGTLPGTPARPPSTATRAPARAGLGMTVGVAHPSLLSGVNGISGGVLVTAIDPDGQTARAGLRRGDVIVEVDGTDVTSPAAFQRQAATLSAGQVVRFRVIRDRRPLFVAFEYGG